MDQASAPFLRPIETKFEIFVNWQHWQPVLKGEIRHFAFHPAELGIATCHPEDDPECPWEILYSAILENR